MTVKDDNNTDICQMTDCRHPRCGNCETKQFDVPMGPFGGPIFDDEAPAVDPHYHCCEFANPYGMHHRNYLDGGGDGI